MFGNPLISFTIIIDIIIEKNRTRTYRTNALKAFNEIPYLLLIKKKHFKTEIENVF